MVEVRKKREEPSGRWRPGMELTTIVAIGALTLSGLSFYRSYVYEKQQLDITVTEVSYVTNQGELYMTVAFANGGNRDAALLRVEPALWGHHNKKDAAWIPLIGKVHADIPVTWPKTPLVVRAGGVEIVTLSARLDPLEAEQAVAASRGGAFVGIRVATHECRRQFVPCSSPGCPLGDRSAGPNPRRGAGYSPEFERLHRPRRSAAGRPTAIQQEDSLRVGGRTLLTIQICEGPISVRTAGSS